MGTLFSALDIARAGLGVSQVQLDITGNNIANVNKEGFSRQRVELISRAPNLQPFGAIGRGPGIANISRLRDDFLDIAFREQVSGLGRAESQATFFTRIEDIFQEPSDDGLASRLNFFFDALNDFANQVDSQPVRVALISEAESVAATFQEVAERLNILRTNANEEVRSSVDTINSLTDRIAKLNESIQAFELTGRTANDLRDDRDVLLDELAQLVNISYRERDDGVVDVLLGGDSLITGNRVRVLETVPDATIDPDRPDLLAVQFVDNGVAANVSNGSLSGALAIRDVELRGLEDQFDQLAGEFVQAINSIQSQGNGLVNIEGPVSSTNPVLDPALALASAELPFTFSDGSFDIVAYDATGAIAETISVPIQAVGPIGGQTTLQDVANAINASANLTASIAGNRLSIVPGADTSFVFANDTAGILPALGINGLFTGSTADTIAVDPRLVESPELVSSGFSTDVLDTGDNTAALALAAVRTQTLFGDGLQTFNGFFESIVAEVGIDSRANRDLLDVELAFVQDFERRRQEVSGVNLDEETTFLLQFQRAFEANSRVIVTVDRLLETLINLVR